MLRLDYGMISKYICRVKKPVVNIQISIGDQKYGVCSINCNSFKSFIWRYQLPIGARRFQPFARVLLRHPGPLRTDLHNTAEAEVLPPNMGPMISSLASEQVRSARPCRMDSKRGVPESEERVSGKASEGELRRRGDRTRDRILLVVERQDPKRQPPSSIHQSLQ